MRDASTPKSRMFLRPLFLGARQDCEVMAPCLQLSARCPGQSGFRSGCRSWTKPTHSVPRLARPNPAARRCLQLNAGELTRFNIAESYRTRERWTVGAQWEKL